MFCSYSALGSDTTPLPSWAALHLSTWGSLKQALKGLSVEFALLADKAAQQVSGFLLLGSLVPEHAVLCGGAPLISLALRALCRRSPVLVETACTHLFWVAPPEPLMLLRRPLVTETDWVLVPSPGVAEVKWICPWHPSPALAVQFASGWTTYFPFVPACAWQPVT